jgi:hypothetical protein
MDGVSLDPKNPSHTSYIQDLNKLRKPSETTSSPIELSQRAKMISKALQNRGVAPEVADHFANKADGSNPEMPTEDFRQATFDAFEKAGGKFPKEEGNRNVDVEAIKGQVNPETGENFTQEEAEAEVVEAQRRNQEDQDNAHQQNKELINENQPKSNSEVETDGTQTESNDNKGQSTENGNSSSNSQHPVEPETNRGNGDQLPSGTQTDSEVANQIEGAEEVSLKNTNIDKKRLARGEEPIMAPERQSDPVTWDKAGREADQALLAKLQKAGDEHAKSLRGHLFYILLEAPRYMWPEMDTYTIGVQSLGSTSTMHREAKQFSGADLVEFKENLTEGTLQCRMKIFSEPALLRIVHQRKSHRLPDWHEFCDFVEQII